MAGSIITRISGSDWWIQRTDRFGRQSYPERIRVGKLDAPRVYVPERTCSPVFGECSECKYPLHDHARYCTNCGARIKVASE